MHSFFIEALDLREHPIKSRKAKVRARYYTALSYIVQISVDKSESLTGDGPHVQEQDSFPAKIPVQDYVMERLKIYKAELLGDENIFHIPDADNEKACLRAVAACVKWKREYRSMVVCDAALILLEQPLVVRAAETVKSCLSNRKKGEIEKILSFLFDGREADKKYLRAVPLIQQYRRNLDFMLQKERRIIVTATVSAGKSTLINALAGRPLARTSMETCTGNICYLFNKAFEDGGVHLAAQTLTLQATKEELRNCGWTEKIYMASYFAGTAFQTPRLCVIDTPGVDAFLYKDHKKLARDALLYESYDRIVYVTSPDKWETDAENDHLNWISQHLARDKIIFVLNKIDTYEAGVESVDDTVRRFRDYLQTLGFEKPAIYPISAYFAYLLKRKMTGQTLSDDESDEYEMQAKRFKRSSRDVSRYYQDVKCEDDDSEEKVLSKHTGLYGLEKIIYGG